MDVSGAPIRPGSTPAMRAALSTLRTELARAQRKDPRLADIIACLKRENPGTYLAEPRMPEGRRTQVECWWQKVTVNPRKTDQSSRTSPMFPPTVRLPER